MAIKTGEKKEKRQREDSRTELNPDGLFGIVSFMLS